MWTPPRWTLRTRVFALLLAGALVPLLVVDWIDLTATRTRIFAAQAELLGARGDQIAGEIDQFNQRYALASRRVSGIPDVVAFLRDPSTRDQARAGLQARLRVLLIDDRALAGIGVVDRSGIIIAATDPRALAMDVSRRGFFRAVAAHHAIVSCVYVAPEAGDEPTVAYAATVRADPAEPLGYLVFWVHAEALWSLMRRSNGRAGAGSYAVMLDEQGIRIGHTYSREIVFHPAGPLAPELTDALIGEQRFGAATAALMRDVQPFAEQFDRARAGELDPELFHGYAPVNQQFNYGVGRRLTTAPWTVFYMVPEATLAAPIDEATWHKLVFALIVVLITGALGVGFARQIIAPLAGISAAANRLARGDMTARAPSGRGDELGALAASFNAMADEVAAARQRLESQVAEGESDLATTLDSIGDAVIATDQLGRVTRMNPIAEELTGWSFAAARGRSLGDVFVIVDEDHRKPVESPVDRVLREGHVVGLANHTTLIARTGGETPIADSAAPIVGRDGKPRGVVLVFRDVHAERAAERALVASELKYRDLYELAPDMYLTADIMTGRIIDCNQTLCDRLGHRKDELVGQLSSVVYHADYRFDQSAATAQFQDTGELVDVERVLCGKDGSTIPVSMNVRAIRGVDGQIVAARALWRDISERKQADRDLQLLVRLGEVLRSSTDEDELLYSVCVDIAHHLAVPRCSISEIDAPADRSTIHRDVHGDYPSIAGTFTLSVFGTTVIDQCRRGETIVVDDTMTDPRTAAAYQTSYLPISVRAWIAVPLLRNGEWVAALTVGTAAPRSWQPREVHLLGLVAERVWVWIEHLRVLTELRDRSVREAIERTEARSRILIEAIQDYAVLMLDRDGVIASWNAGAQRIKGYTAGEIVGRSFAMFYTPEDLAAGHPQEVLERARTTGRYEEEGWRVRKDGTRFWASIVVTAVRDSRGELDGFAKVTRDISERRRQDQELRARQAQLTQHVKERDVLLQEIHHRVKNNLQVISSLINMQVRRLEPGSSREALEECQTRVLAIALIHEKLYQSKDYAEVQFSEYASSLAANVFHTLGVARRAIALELAIDPIPLSIDRAIPCGLVINELITNALKHAFKGERGGVVRVALSRAGRELALEVSDDGVGLPDGWDIGKMESLGMQLVATLTEQLDGRLRVASRAAGRAGTSFQITFPGGS